MPNCLFYTRCSTLEQAKGTSHEYQIEGLRHGIGGYTEVGHFQDTASGTRFDNRAEGLDAAYTLCLRRRGSVEAVLAYRWDRFGRDVGECFRLIKRFREIGVEVNVPDERIDYSDPSWPIILGVKFGAAQSESLRISDRTRDGLHACELSGIWPYHAPVGYVKGPEQIIGGKPRRVCEFHPATAEIVRKCFQAYADGETKAELFALYGKTLGVAKSQFCRLFHNPFYTGAVYVKAHRNSPAQSVQGAHPALVSASLFERCQQIKEESGHTTLGKTWTVSPDVSHGEFWLKGVLKGENGRNMTAYKSKGRSGHRFSYYSEQQKKGGQIVSVERAHWIVGQAIRGFRIDPEMRDEIRAEAEAQTRARQSAATATATAARAGAEKAEKRLERIRADYADGNISAKECREMAAGFEEDLLRFEAKILEAEVQMGDIDDVVARVGDMLLSIDTVFAAANPDYKARILRAMFPKGFKIDPKTEVVRTAEINDFVFAMCSKSIANKWVEIENDTEKTTCVVKGAEGGRYRTHAELLKTLAA